jgi:hypothetical protein
MRNCPLPRLIIAGVLLAGCSSARGATADPAPSSATDASAAAGRDSGWRALFDGRSLAGWHGYHQRAPTNWRVVDGTLAVVAPGPDLVTDGQYTNFDLALDWKVEPGGNSGIMYRVDDKGEQTYVTGPEMQILDDARHADGKSPLTSAGSNHSLYPAPRGVVRPAREWNAARVLVNGNHVEHWLNGTKVVEYELGSPDWEAKVQASKFRNWKDFGRSPRGFIALQAHGDTVTFRNIRIRVLP